MIRYLNKRKERKIECQKKKKKRRNDKKKDENNQQRELKSEASGYVKKVRKL